MNQSLAPTEKYFRPGQFVFHEGEQPRSLILVKKGTVSIRKMKGGAYVEIARVFSNEVIGELSFFDRLPRSAAAVALTEVEALEIKFEALDHIYGTVPPYLKTIISCMADRLRKADDTIRRLQKEVVHDGSDTSSSVSKEEPSYADVLAATAPVKKNAEKAEALMEKGSEVDETKDPEEK